MFSFIKLVVFFLFLITNNCSAGLEKHLKKAENKDDYHKIKNIDFIYMINLDHRPEKFKDASERLYKYGIYPYRFSAVNGWELSVQALNDVGVLCVPGMHPVKGTAYPPNMNGKPIFGFMKIGQVYFSHHMSKGAVGIVLSHVSVLKDAYDSGYETIWVLEDDIETVKDPWLMSDLIEKLDRLVGKDNWDMLFTDRNTKGRDGKYVIAYGQALRPEMDCSIQARYCKEYTIDQQISEDFRKIGARFGAYSMILRRSGIKKLLDFFLEHKIFLPYDIDYYYPKSLQKYSLTYDVVGPKMGAISDNKFCTYKSQRPHG